jgi:hypothetical protein
VICLSKDPCRVSLTSEDVKPLLILDLNGVLGEREPYDINSPGALRKFRRRPWCDEFLQLMSQYYEIAVWSCANGKNITISLNGAFQNNPNIKLLFQWCSDEATSLYPRTSIVSSAKVCKIYCMYVLCMYISYCYVNYIATILIICNLRQPLFLKELSKVWKLFPSYGAHNTVLVDNHIEKFEVCII